METNKSSNKGTAPKKTNYVRKIVRLLWMGTVLGLLLFFGIFAATYFGLLGKMPDVKDLESPDIYVASQIISQDGKVLDKFEMEKRIPVEYDRLPKHLVNALLAKEDKRFFEHSGIDGSRTLTATLGFGSKGGGSTITQQLAKLLFSDKPKNKIDRVLQKIKEYIVSVQLERLYTKEEIIAMYFNKYNYFYGANGIQMASKVYFNKDVKDLSLDEAAIFVAMLQKPSEYNPKSNPEGAMRGRDGVLNYMAKEGFISVEEARAHKSKPIQVNYRPVKEAGHAYSAYYKEALKDEIQSYFEDYEKQSGKKYDLYKDGLKIYVTIDSKMQTYAEEAMREHLIKVQRQFNGQHSKSSSRYPYKGVSEKQAKRLIKAAMRRTDRYKTLKAKGLNDSLIVEEFKKPTRLEIFTWKGRVDTLMSPWDSIRYHKSIVRGSIMSMEPQTGSIKAWVGGIDWEHFKYDLVKQGKRQVGSTFKPIVYCAAMKEIGYNPCTMISNATYSEGGWNVKGSGGSLTIRNGLAYSKNPIAARLISDVGVDLTIKLAREMGITAPLPRNKTIALGSAEISLFEMVGAYGTLANYGNYIKPEMIWRIEDSQGKVLKENLPEIKEVMNEKFAYQMLDIMQGVTKFGTAKRMSGLGISAAVAGKTGTTNDNSDAWFMGITPKLITGVWVGWEDRFSNIGSGEGASSALPVWTGFMKRVYNDTKLGYSQKDKFIIPDEKNYTECGYENSGDMGAGIGVGVGDIESGDALNKLQPRNNNNSGTKPIEKPKDVNDQVKDTLNWDQ